jgi:membrane dipeptidase
MTTASLRPTLILLVCIANTIIHAQTITLGGTIRDSYSVSPVESIRVDISQASDPGKLYTVYTSAAGTWSYSFLSTGAGRTDVVPFAFDLQQNFPNPFNPSTTIYFSVPWSGPVTVLVHNILGQKIDARTYSLAPGGYSVRWTGKGAAGPLFYTVQSGGRSMTKKMIQLDGGNGEGLGNVMLVGGFAPALRKSAASDFSVMVTKLGYEPDSITVAAVNNSAINFSLTTVHRRAFVFDLHNDVAEYMINGYQIGIRHTSNQSDIPRFLDGGVDAQMIVLWTDSSKAPTTPYQRTIQMYDTCVAQFNRNSATIARATTSAEIQSIHAAGKIAAVLCVEGGHAIQEDLNKLINFYNLGARYFTITWNYTLPWATAASDPLSATKGLSDFGRQVIRTADSLGMLIDVSHVGIKTIEDILAVTKNPIIASHSGVRALRNSTRNLTDDQIKAIAQGDGVIGVVFYTSFLSSYAASSVNIDTVIKHIDYIKNLVGIDHVAIGSDYDGGITAPVGLENVSKLQNLTMALLRKGYSPADARKILGENYLRVFKAVCK